MIDKGINLYISKKFDELTLLDMFSQAGFDSVIIPFDFVDSYKQKTLSILKKNNLKLQMVHCRYKEEDLDYFWQDDLRGQKVFDDYIYQIENIKHLSPVDFIIHLACTKGNHYSKLGQERLQKIITKAKGCGVRVCVENTFSTYQQIKIFENISDENLKMCYDCGHENWLTPEDNLIDIFKEKIVQIHLHNNDGTFDQHQPIFEGKIDVKNKAKQLATIPNKIALCLELKFVDDRLSLEFLKEMKKSLDVLELMMK